MFHMNRRRGFVYALGCLLASCRGIKAQERPTVVFDLPPYDCIPNFPWLKGCKWDKTWKRVPSKLVEKNINLSYCFYEIVERLQGIVCLQEPILIQTSSSNVSQYIDGVVQVTIIRCKLPYSRDIKEKERIGIHLKKLENTRTVYLTIHEATNNNNKTHNEILDIKL